MPLKILSRFNFRPMKHNYIKINSCMFIVSLGIFNKTFKKNLKLMKPSSFLLIFNYAELLSLLTSWMSSPSRKRTGFRVSRWSNRKVLGSLSARTMHLDKIKHTYNYVRRRNTDSNKWIHLPTLPVGINACLWSIVFCVTSEKLHHHFCCSIAVKSKD